MKQPNVVVKRVTIEVNGEPVRISFFRNPILWFDCHPRSGWYVGAVVTLHLLLDTLNFL